MSVRALVTLLFAGLLALGLVAFCGVPGPNPTGVVPGSTTVAAPGTRPLPSLSGGLEHTCALVAGGRVSCWGSSFNGQLGYGNGLTIGDDESPASAGFVNVGGVVTRVSAGSGHTCAQLDTGAVRCWGLGVGGRLGYGDTDIVGDDEVPASKGDVDVGGSVAQIAAGGVHTCALLDTGAVRCWGSNTSGELGYGNTVRIGDDETPASVGDVDVGGTVTQIAVGGNHTCALLDTGTVRCWGLAANGQLGYGNTESIGDDESPASAGDVDVGGVVTGIAAGGNHTCALLDTGAVRCWGAGLLGQLGYGNSDQIGDDESPASVGDVDVGGRVTQVSVGGGHTCALLAGGAVRCWGDGGEGRLGYVDTQMIGDDETPSTSGDVDIGSMAVQIVAAGAHSCAVTTGGAIRCWGSAGSGALGYGNRLDIGDDEAPVTAGDVLVP